MNINKKILVIINDSWGEVDWILPVLYHLNDRWNAKITVFFNSDEIYDEKNEYKDLNRLLEIVSNKIITPKCLKEKSKFTDDTRPLFTKHDLLKNKLRNGIDYIFHDFSGVDYVQYYNDFPQAKVVVFPHGTFVYGWLSEKLKKEVSHTLFFDTIKKDALMLVGSERDVSFFKELTRVNNIVVSGHPKLGKNWVELLAGVEREGENYQPNKDENLRILFIQYPRRRIKNKTIFDNLVSSVFEFAKESNAQIILKRHPRQDKIELENLLKEGEGLKVRFADESVLSSASKSHIAISFPSSACMDAIVLGIPVIEYFDYSGQTWSTFLKASTGTSSIYREMNLVLPANNSSELRKQLNLLINDIDYYREITNLQLKSLNQLKLVGNGTLNAIERAIERL